MIIDLLTERIFFFLFFPARGKKFLLRGKNSEKKILVKWEITWKAPLVCGS